MKKRFQSIYHNLSSSIGTYKEKRRRKIALEKQRQLLLLQIPLVLRNIQEARQEETLEKSLCEIITKQVASMPIPTRNEFEKIFADMMVNQNHLDVSQKQR